MLMPTIMPIIIIRIILLIILHMIMRTVHIMRIIAYAYDYAYYGCECSGGYVLHNIYDYCDYYDCYCLCLGL